MAYKNLLVSGCSFTKDWGNGWPTALKDILGIPNLYDCSIPGGGNTHIHHSIISKLEMYRDITPNDTLVGVMWTGANRIDTLVSKASLGEYFSEYQHCPGVFTGLTGGQGTDGNLKAPVLGGLYDIKDERVLSYETFINVVSLHHYLESRGFKHFFLNWRDMNLPARDKAHDWTKHVPDVSDLFLDIQDMYTFSLKRDMMLDDDYHPHSDGRKLWCQEVLAPRVKEIL